MRILFVCTGNTCRSPMAEGILRSMAEKRDLKLEVKSAGISVYNGDLASKNSIEAMKKIDIDISGHFATQLNSDLIQEADLVLTLSSSHKDFIVSNYPWSREKVFTLNEYAYGVKKDITDPYGKNLAFYERTRDEIYQAVLNAIEKEEAR